MTQYTDVPEFKIHEVTGQRRTVILTQRGLPFRPLSMSGTQRVEVTTPPGSPDGISSVTGPVEDDTTIHGKWGDKYIGATTAITNNSFQVTNVIAAVRLFDDIRISGQLLEVSWGPIFRVGHISKFDHTWDNIHDVDWSITFKWVARGRISYAVQPTPNLSSIAGGIRALLDRLKGILAGLAVNPFGDEMDDLFAMTQKIASLSNDIDAISNNFTDIITGPFSIASNFKQALDSIVGVCIDFQDKVDASFGSATGLYMDPDMNAGHSVSEGVLASLIGGALPSTLAPATLSLLIPIQSDAQDLKTTAREMRDMAVEASRALKEADSDVLATHKARKDENLRNVSLMYYGTALQWRFLMLWNQLDSAELEAGTVVIIPRLGDNGMDGR